jgi:hypothetical protein
MHEDLMQAACTSLGLEKHIQAKNRGDWYGRPESMLA